MARKEAVIMHEDHRKRVKERFLKDGIENMPDHEVLELLLFFSIPRKDTNALAHELIEHFGSLNCVLEASAEDLMQVNGIGETSATLITLAFQLTKKYLKNASDKKLKKYDGPESAKELLMSQYLGAREEMVYMLSLDFDDNILTDKDALRERDRQDVRDGLMQKWEYRVKWYNETEEVAKCMCPVESTSDPFNLG